jgi:hypothetical protein
MLSLLQVLPIRRCNIVNIWSYRNKQQDATVQWNLLFQCFLIARHLSSDTPLIIRSSKLYLQPLVLYTFVVLSSWWWAVCRSKHVEQLRNIEIINYITRSHFLGYFYTIYIMMHGSMNIKFWKFYLVQGIKELRWIKLQLQSFLTSALGEASGQIHVPTALSPEKVPPDIH